MKKKIAILLSGNIRIHEENRKCLIDFFRDFEITIFATIWNNQKNINEFVQYYQINNYNLIELKNWESTLSKVKYVTGEENRSFKIENIFHMWLSISESIKLVSSAKVPLPKNQNSKFSIFGSPKFEIENS